MEKISISTEGYLACGNIEQGQSVPCFFQPPLQSPFSPIPTSAQLPSGSASFTPPPSFLLSHLTCGVTGVWLSSVGHGWSQRGARSVAEAETAGRVAVGSGFPSSRWSLLLHLCVRVRVRVCVRTQGCRETLTSEGTTSPFLFNSSAHAQLLYGASCPSAPADHAGLLCTAPKRFFPSYTVLRGCRQSYPLSPPPFSFSSGLNQGSAMPPA